MNHSTTMAERGPDTLRQDRRQHTPLSAIDPLGTDTMRSAGRVTDPAVSSVRPVTFNSTV